MRQENLPSSNDLGRRGASSDEMSVGVKGVNQCESEGESERNAATQVTHRETISHQPNLTLHFSK